MARVLHIMGVMPDKFGTPFQEFANTCLSHHDHAFVAFSAEPVPSQVDYSFDTLPSGTFQRIAFLRNRINSWPSDVVIFHSLFYSFSELAALLGLLSVSD